MSSKIRRFDSQAICDKIEIFYLPHYRGLEELSFAKTGDSGFDLRAAIGEFDTCLKPGDIKVIPNGIKVNLPSGYEIQVRPRSGLAAKYGVTVLNAPGTIDNMYKGELSTILINHGKEDFIIKRGDRIAQAVPILLTSVRLETITVYDDNSERGAGGFGSTGV